MWVTLAKAALKLTHKFLNEKKVCSKYGCTNLRQGTSELCQKHEQEKQDFGCLVMTIVLIIIAVAIYQSS